MVLHTQADIESDAFRYANRYPPHSLRGRLSLKNAFRPQFVTIFEMHSSTIIARNNRSI